MKSKILSIAKYISKTVANSKNTKNALSSTLTNVHPK